jgi:segregation and condensation protein B
MSIQAKIEAIIYAAEDPVSFEQIFALVKEEARQELEQAHMSSAPAVETATQMAASALLESATASSAWKPDESLEEDASPVTPGIPAEAGMGNVPTVVEASPAREAVGAGNEPPPPELPSEPSPGSPAESLPDAISEGALQTAGTEASLRAPEPGLVTDAEVRQAVRAALSELTALYSSSEHGLEVRQIAGGYRMATKPEHHDVVRAFAKSLKPPIRLSLPALETLAVIAYKQPITAPEIAEIRGVDTSGVLGTLLDRKLITTSGRKQVVGRPILYKTTREFLLRFGLKGVEDLPSMEEFEKLAIESLGADLFTASVPDQAAKTAAATAAGAELEPEAETEQPAEAQLEAAPAPEVEAKPERSPTRDENASTDTIPAGSADQSVPSATAEDGVTEA